ncbi:MAG: hypothetical protein F2658_04910 [Actinobacteria bacterium]|uniref:Unannotated protein n=1 Tax=freshwater metagenome TaxID=449393 RepID=A0A6J6NZD3_9ZZZZ|nr:hypothetical protein [Actinomycetota bacterium]
MKSKALIAVVPLSLMLTGCGVTDFAKNAADATACKALSSTIKGIVSGYQSGVIDSGLIVQIDNLVGDQLRALLSTGLANDLKLLTETFSQSQSAEGSKEQVKKLTDSITQRCSDAGVEPAV